ncbi:MAG: VanZ family protein [Candidatus Halalkalibacterium sp. M3_1C_030]
MKEPLIDYLSRSKYLIPGLFTLLTLIMLFLTLVPMGTLGSSAIWGYDKLGHFLLFASWTFLLGAFLYVNNSYKLNLFTIFFIGVCFGIIIEVFQYLLPFQRSAELFDIAFDSLGSLAGVLALKKLFPDKD